LTLTDQQVLVLAPDSGAAANGRKLAMPKHWRGLGRSAHALWGECQGSALYQVQVDLHDLSAKCSCPSRKFPCKHALGLLFLATGDSLPEDQTPDWVTAWLDKRTATAKAKETREAAPAAPVDPAKQAARAAKRESRVAEGLQAFDTWLEDMVRSGLAGLERQPAAYWESQAARLVDAQAPVLASRVRRMAVIPASGPGWPERLLAQLGKAALLTEAFKRLDALTPGLQADVRQAVGWTLSEDEVLAHGDRPTDHWLVAGQWSEVEARTLGATAGLTVVRTWLRGARTGRWALVLQFDVPGAPARSPRLVPGTAFEAELAFWPSAWPQRALLASPPGGLVPVPLPPAGDSALVSPLAAMADALARHPWADRVPCLLEGVVPTLAPSGAWWLLDGHDAALPLGGEGLWRLLAASGGRPITLAAEWDGERLRPLTAWADGALHPIAGGA
jgi:hypothetical protein